MHFVCNTNVHQSSQCRFFNFCWIFLWQTKDFLPTLISFGLSWAPTGFLSGTWQRFLKPEPLKQNLSSSWWRETTRWMHVGADMKSSLIKFCFGATSSTLVHCSLIPNDDWLTTGWVDVGKNKYCHRLCHSVPAAVDCSSLWARVRYPLSPSQSSYPPGCFPFSTRPWGPPSSLLSW